MPYDTHDTIAAVASAVGGAARGVVRISGSDASEGLSRCFIAAEQGAKWPLNSCNAPRRIEGAIRVRGEDDGDSLTIPGSLLLWPGERSYTRQPSAEFHTVGSPPLLAAIVEELSRQGVRPAEPGEFTLRAFLAGRIDLTQAEGVLGVIDAEGRDDLDAALDQLAGGLSRPLHQIREDLLALLAELEAGLDFVEEDIEFISRQSLSERIARARLVVETTRAQLSDRDRRQETPRVAIVGLPNAGKSSLFNALMERYGDGDRASSIVSPQPGATRDYVVGRLNLNGLRCELVDTAGVDEAEQTGILQAAHAASGTQRRLADLRLACLESTSDVADSSHPGEIIVLTKCDLRADHFDFTSNLSVAPAADSHFTRCSSATGEGLDSLATRIRIELGRRHDDSPQNGGAAATAARCASSLKRAAESLAAAAALVDEGADELLAAEIRSGLDALGEMVGAFCTDDVLDRVFGQFCIGK
jgi:tRNA modification GTPase